FFIIDEPFYNNGFYRQHQQLFDIGKAFSEGIEMMVQKKLAKNIYGLASLSWFRSRYQDYGGIWRERIFDQRLIASIEGGFKPSDKWEFSLHWIYSGGRPYTPFDEAKSLEANTGVLNSNLVNQARNPHFNYLNLRVDRRWHFSRTNLVLYLSVYNALNRQNVSAYYWNSAKQQVDTIYQWGALPIFGIEYEF
ncbi:hypothetical protein JXA02_06805, partial [candidate division KSB1 bacterium]|nr:hypothetical protein [candidate division KSB1 bacterium]